jgi:hypothetical protein
MRRRAAFAGAFALLAAAMVLIGATTAGALKAKQMGKTESTPNPSCPTPSGPHPPRQECQAFGEVTGFQVEADGKNGLFKVPSDGNIVAWSLDLARPSESEQQFFRTNLGNEGFDGDPTARISLLKRAEGAKYRLKARSPIVRLQGSLGDPLHVTLNDPIAVREGWIVALTSPTWVPNFAHDISAGNRWRASRNPERCSGFENLTELSRPHETIDTRRTYGCTYGNARLLYWAWFVPNS